MEKGKYNILNFKLYYIIQGYNMKVEDYNYLKNNMDIAISEYNDAKPKISQIELIVKSHREKLAELDFIIKNVESVTARRKSEKQKEETIKEIENQEERLKEVKKKVQEKIDQVKKIVEEKLETKKTEFNKSENKIKEIKRKYEDNQRWTKGLQMGKLENMPEETREAMLQAVIETQNKLSNQLQEQERISQEVELEMLQMRNLGEELLYSKMEGLIRLWDSIGKDIGPKEENLLDDNSRLAEEKREGTRIVFNEGKEPEAQEEESLLDDNSRLAEEKREGTRIVFNEGKEPEAQEEESLFDDNSRLAEEKGEGTRIVFNEGKEPEAQEEESLFDDNSRLAEEKDDIYSSKLKSVRKNKDRENVICIYEYSGYAIENGDIQTVINLKDVIKKKKKLFNNININERIERLTQKKWIMRKIIKGKVNPAIIAILEKKRYGSTLIDEYIQSLVDKKELPFKLIHRGYKSGLGFMNKILMRRWGKAEAKIKGTDVEISESILSNLINKFKNNNMLQQGIDKSEDFNKPSERKKYRIKDVRKEFKVNNPNNEIEAKAQKRMKDSNQRTNFMDLDERNYKQIP